MKNNFLVCEHCGNIAKKIIDKKVPLVCCGQPMKELVAGTVDASKEKHIPEVVVDGTCLSVTVGAVEHPMEEAHFIEFIYVETENGGMKKKLVPGDAPKADFCICSDKPVAVYEYCNLHGLWKVEL